MDYDDPGWWPAFRGGLFRSLRRRGEPDRDATPLVALRGIFVGLGASLWLFLLVVSFLDREPAAARTQARVNIAVTAVGFVVLLILFWVRAKPLKGSDERTMLASYRGRFFIMIGLAEAPAFGGLAASFFTGSLWTFVIGLVIATIGFSLAAPNRRNIEFEQQKLVSQGSPFSLGQLLTRPYR